MVLKEFIQMRRDRLTFGMMVGIPLLQLVLFGYAINSDPKHLPTAVQDNDRGVFARDLTWGMKNSGYFDFRDRADDQRQVRQLLDRGDASFVLTIPPGFTRGLLRGERPQVLLEADATDPAATINAVAALNQLAERALERDFTGAVRHLKRPAPAVDLRIHPLYNPEAVTQYNIVPGLMGVVLTMTLVIITAVALTRERERGTMENLLATPVRPVEVMIGKIVPYILVGYVQVTLILLAAKFLFDVPMRGSLVLLGLVSLLFIAANLMVGVTFSTLARTQLQAVQMAFFFFLPSILLSGFMFPFRGMPRWAQWIGEALPLTHFLRNVRGVLLKGNGWAESLPHLWPVALFFAVMLAVGLVRYRRTLD
ncbi:MAG: ABC transporter permease [Lentisphaeria bacterium]